MIRKNSLSRNKCSETSCESNFREIRLVRATGDTPLKYNYDDPNPSTTKLPYKYTQNQEYLYVDTQPLKRAYGECRGDQIANSISNYPRDTCKSTLDVRCHDKYTSAVKRAPLNAIVNQTEMEPTSNYKQYRNKQQENVETKWSPPQEENIFWEQPKMAPSKRNIGIARQSFLEKKQEPVRRDVSQFDCDKSYYTSAIKFDCDKSNYTSAIKNSKGIAHTPVSTRAQPIIDLPIPKTPLRSRREETLEKLKMVSEFNKKINERIQHVIMCFEGLRAN